MIQVGATQVVAPIPFSVSPTTRGCGDAEKGKLMAQYRVDSDELAGAVGATHSQIDQVRSAAAQLTATLTALESSWTGQGSAAFQNAVQEWRTAQLTVEDAIASINQALGQAADQYGSAEANVARMFSV